VESHIIEQIEIYKQKSSVHSVKDSWVEKHLSQLFEYLKVLPGETVSEKLFLLENSKISCKICGADTKFLSYNRGYRTFCSKKCSNNDSELSSIRIESFKKTSLEKWGVDNPAKVDTIKDKIKDSKKSLDICEMISKSKETSLKKYGVDNISKLDSVKESKRQKSLDAYGVDNPFKSEEIKEKSKKVLLEKWGVEHPLKSLLIKEKIRKTNLERYGVENPSQTSFVKDLKFSRLNEGLTQTTISKEPEFSEYLGEGRYQMLCDNGESHLYEIGRHLYHARRNSGGVKCTICSPIGEQKSVKEEQLYKWVLSIYDGEVIQSYRDGLEIDIYFPELSIGIEFNGLYWHSELFKEKDYHLKKTNYFAEKGIRIYHIWEDDWNSKEDIIKSQISNWLGVTKNKVFARKCQVEVVNDSKLVRSFLDKNHIQGFVRYTLCLGLYQDKELVSIMCFDHTEGRKKMVDTEWNLSRFCNRLNSNVVGGASKLLSYFIKVFKPDRMITFADKEWSVGDLYFKLGFEKSYETEPNYKYLVDKKRTNKQRFKKSRLVSEGYDINKSEAEIMSEREIWKVWDCGQIKFEIIF
jgi:hypothetical protein